MCIGCIVNYLLKARKLELEGQRLARELSEVKWRQKLVTGGLFVKRCSKKKAERYCRFNVIIYLRFIFCPPDLTRIQWRHPHKKVNLGFDCAMTTSD